ncbi:hypothetical protein BGZ46_001048 [Entomortierella lignicola]|nr:hypothetical protein BGZ46_001048 [Entomortierella lignicola]
MTKTKPASNSHSKNVFHLHGVNVLNRKNIDSIARLTALERRRTTHILDERQRRDTMNQLLNELASLIRESASEIDGSQQQQQQLQQISVPGLNTDGRPPVKSNSITTLRNAINEIQRLRACVEAQNTNSSENQTTTPTRCSSTCPSSPSPSEFSSLSALAELASQHHCSELDSNPNSSCSSPMSSPRLASPRMSSPTNVPSASPEVSTTQLNSPPLSPSEITAQNIAFPLIITSREALGLTTTLPPLYTVVDSACSTPYPSIIYPHQYEGLPQDGKSPVLSEASENLPSPI